ncbi:hypothetical protein [Caldisphaera sp.]|nr:hypothetical protein [Caldisphaera sp.]
MTQFYDKPWLSFISKTVLSRGKSCYVLRREAQKVYYKTLIP